MSDDNKGHTIGDALLELVQVAGGLAVILLMGTCAGCWTIPFLKAKP